MIVLTWKLHDNAVVVIEGMGLEWQRLIVPAEQINVAMSRRNTARAEVLDGDTVDDYEVAMKHGDEFPTMVVVLQQSQYVIAGGNHRHEAAMRLAQTEYDCIVVECNSIEFQRLGKLLNANEGRRTTSKERVLQAIETCRIEGMTAKAASDLFRCTITSVTDGLRACEVRETLGRMGVEVPSRVSSTVLRRMALWNKEDSVLKAMGRFVAKQNPTGQQVRLLNQRLSAAGGESDRLKILREVGAEHKPRRGPSRRHPARRAMLTGMSQLEAAMAKKTNLTQIGISDEERKEVVTRWTSITKLMGSILRNG
jgi:hypothetical protein